MNTQCTSKTFQIRTKLAKELVLDFQGGEITSDAGLPLLNAVEQKLTLFDRLASCFKDYRDSKRVEHSTRDLLAQRILGLALGYEDLNDHDILKRDPLLAASVGKTDLLGKQRLRTRDTGNPLASSKTLNRLELTESDSGEHERYHKIVCCDNKVEKLFVDLFLESHSKAPKKIILDLDHTDVLIHGKQEGRFFHGYYDNYCFLPLFIFCEDQLLVAKLRTSDGDSMRGVIDEVARVVMQIREAWPETKILIRGDSGFCREEFMAWCEAQEKVDFLFGLRKNNRLVGELYFEKLLVEADYILTNEAQRRFKDFQYSTLKSWSRERRVIGKAECLEKGFNPRFIVTSLDPDNNPGQELYERDYCARGEMENRIKEQQLYLFGDRTSAHSFRANQLRLWFSSLAYVLLESLRRLGLKGTKLAKARCDTIRLKLLKIGARVKVTARRIWARLASGYPYQELFKQVWQRLTVQVE